MLKVSQAQQPFDSFVRDCFFSSRRRHTMSLCDWSSDVCSSDLLYRDEIRSVLHAGEKHRSDLVTIESDAPRVHGPLCRLNVQSRARRLDYKFPPNGEPPGTQIGRASCRERV